MKAFMTVIVTLAAAVSFAGEHKKGKHAKKEKEMAAPTETAAPAKAEPAKEEDPW